MGFDGTNKADAGHGQNIAYHTISSPAMEKIKAEVMAKASPEAIAYLDPLNYPGPQVIVDASTLSSDEWQSMRSQSIGSSAASHVFGESPYPNTTNLDLYYEKIGVPRIVDDTKEDKEARERYFLYGHLMEEYLDLVARQKWPRSKIIVDTNIYADPKHPFLTANLDRMMQLSDGSWIHVEFKTTSEYGEEAYANNAIPQHYKRQLIQCQHIMGVWKSRLMCALSRDRIIVRDYVRDLDEEMHQIKGEKDFWYNNVLAHIPPEPLGKPGNVIETLNHYNGFGNPANPELIFGQNDFAAVQKYMALTKQVAALEAQVKALKAEKEKALIPISMLMSDATKAYASDGVHAYELIYKERKARAKFNDELFKIDYPDLYEQYTSVGTSSRQMRAKEVDIRS